MIFKHTFKSLLNWKFDSLVPKQQVKNHSISIAGKELLQVSAAKAFKGDPSLHNPEDLLLSAITSCHMMSYLYCCQLEGIDVLSYSDNSEAILEVYEDGSGKIVKVVLNPTVTIKNPLHHDIALSLHEKANKLCFIANSCNFVVEHHATCLVA